MICSKHNIEMVEQGDDTFSAWYCPECEHEKELEIEALNEPDEFEDEHEYPSIEPCLRCGLPTSSRDNLGEPLCHSCYTELTMTGIDD